MKQTAKARLFWQQLKEVLNGIFFPYDLTCPLCTRGLVGEEHIVCCYCEKELRRCILTPAERISVHEPLAMCISTFSYIGPAQKLIHTMKYQSDTTISLLLGPFMCATLLDTFKRQTWDVVVPVPMHPRKQADRGYNQAKLLADEIALHWQCPIRTDLLFRIRADKSQTTRSAEQRRQAMNGAFVASPKAAGLRILLVDDVLTTGATACACCKELLEAGAAEVILLTACQA